jgi:acyl carrier protein
MTDRTDEKPPPDLAKATALLGAVLDLPAKAIPDDAAIGTFEPWDSLAHMRLILAIEDAVGAPLAPEAIVDLASLRDVASALENDPG